MPSERNLPVWIRDGHRGEALVYHRGLLMADRQMFTIPNAIDKIARIMWNAYHNGYLVLVQRKSEDGAYEYIAIHR